MATLHRPLAGTLSTPVLAAVALAMASWPGCACETPLDELERQLDESITGLYEDADGFTIEFIARTDDAPNQALVRDLGQSEFTYFTWYEPGQTFITVDEQLGPGQWKAMAQFVQHADSAEGPRPTLVGSAWTTITASGDSLSYTDGEGALKTFTRSGGGGGGSGGTPGPVWNDGWWFVQSDKAVQYQLARVGGEGTGHLLRVRYRVNSEDGIFCRECNGYHLFADASGFQYSVTFHPGFELPKVWELPEPIAVDLGPYVTWDEERAILVDSEGSLYSFIDACVDDNSEESRCAGREPGQRYDAY